jgi:hypothetical protein
MLRALWTRSILTIEFLWIDGNPQSVRPSTAFSAFLAHGNPATLRIVLEQQLDTNYCTMEETPRRSNQRLALSLVERLQESLCVEECNEHIERVLPPGRARKHKSFVDFLQNGEKIVSSGLLIMPLLVY